MLLGISRSPRSEQSTRCSRPSPSQRQRSGQVVCPAALELSSRPTAELFVASPAFCTPGAPICILTPASELLKTAERTASAANKAPNPRMSRTGSPRRVKVSCPAAAQ
ncbi:hypothetical protein CHARACLAT_020350 [Characodon lateralis]|uniref:Uncharacterized protein n=1 Tax=Characodon lateralis TaxID=208331 RepID=A0ABU7E231_9TELE|nr:hypothetical protein [Characodon lateralis]